jgi:HSP20 family protein
MLGCLELPRSSSIAACGGAPEPVGLPGCGPALPRATGLRILGKRGQAGAFSATVARFVDHRSIDMKITPWRREAAFPTQNLTSWIQKFFDDDGWFTAPLTSRLPETFTRGNVPPVNVAETDKDMTVTVELPGLKEDDINVAFQGNLLTIRAERKFEEEKKDKQYHRVECQYGTFERSLAMPENLKRDQIDARYKNGILTLTIPKVEPTPATKVKVKTG